MPDGLIDLGKSFKTLPSLPKIVVELMESMRQESLSIDDFSRTLAQDHAMAAKALKLANSSFYGLTRTVVTVSDAVAILGMRAVYSIVQAAAVTQAMPRPSGQALDFDQFWRHSMGVALCARDLANRCELDSDLAFTAGLLHDLGRLVLATQVPERLGQVLAYRQQHDCLLHEAERELLGFDHADVGRLLTEQWRIGPELVHAVASHHVLSGASSVDIAGLIHVADNMVHALGIHGANDDLVPPLDLGTWAALKLNESDCHSIFTEVEAQLDEVCRLYLS